MKDEVIRIILEAKDRLSNTVKNAEKNINQSFGNIRNDLKKTDKDFEKFQNDFTRGLNKQDSAMKRWSTSMRQHFRGIRQEVSETRKELDKAIGSKVNIGGPSGDSRFPTRFTSAAADREAQREANRPPRNPAFVAASTAFGAFQQGRQQAAELEKQIRSQVAATKKELEEKKKALEERIHLEREAVIEDGNIQREQLRRDIVEISKNLDASILKLNQAEANRQAKRDEALNKRIRKVNEAFETRRKKAEDALNEEIYQRKQTFYDEQFDRKQQLRDDIEEVKRSSQLSKLAKDKEIDALRKAEADINRKEQRRRDEDVRALEVADDKIKRGDATARDIDIAEKKAAASEIRRLDSQSTDEKVRKLKAGASEVNKEEEVALAAALRKRRQAAETEFRALRQGLRTGNNEADIVKEFLEARKAEQALNQDTSALGRTFQKAGNAFGDFTRGIRRGRSDLREADKLAKSADTAFSRFGQTIGQFTKNIGNLVNLRWYILISAIQVLGQLVLVLAANLVSLASSAAIAASALGAGLVAAASQAIPVVGLLYAAFSRVTAAFTAAQQASKAGATSSQDARAQAEAQTAAQQRLTDALYSQVQAVKAVADARRQAKRDIVDSINAEIDANFALKDAEFAVLDAKQQLRDLEKQNQQDQQSLKDAEAAVKEAKDRLAAAKKQGDQAEIEKAQEQLALAQQNLQDVKGQASKSNKRQIDEQKLAVKEAEQQVKEAKIAQQRQREDTAKTVRLGVKGNQAVVDALHGVATANREVADAQRGVTDAQNKQLSSGNILQRQLSQLDPAERALYKAFRAIQKSFKETFRPITDIIVNAVTGAVKRVGKVLQNPEIINGFKGLAKAIGKGITDLSKFFTSKGFLHDFAGFIHAATGNIPTLIKIIENLTGAFVGLAKAGQPIVKDLLGRFAGVTGSLSGAINAPASQQQRQQSGNARETRGQAFIAKAKTYLDSWIRLADAIGRVFKYLFLDAAPSGNNLVGALTRMFNNLANFLRDNPQKVKKFFDGMVTSLKQISSALFPIVKVLLSAFTGSNAAAFTQFTAQVVIPGLALMLQFTTALAGILLTLSHIPGVKFFLQLLVAEKALNRVFPATQKVTDAIKKMGKWFFVAGEDGSRGFTKLWRAMQFAAFKIKYWAVLARDALKRIAVAALDVSKKVVAAMATAVKAVAKFVWEMAVAAVKAMAAFAKSVYELAVKALAAFVAFIVETVVPALITMGAAMYAALGPWGLLALAIVAIVTAIIIWRHKVLAALEYVFNWIKDHWKILAIILFGPFGLVIIAIVKWKDKIIGFFEGIINWVKSHWKTILVAALLAPFGIGGLIILAIYKFKDKILSVFKDIVNGIKHIFSKVAHWLTANLEPHLHIHHWHGIPYPSITFGDAKDLVKEEGGDKEQAPTYVPPHNGKKGKIINKDGRPVMDTGGRVPGHDGQAVPIIAHAGEWILNKGQQLKLARKLNDTTGQVKDFLFGADRSKKNKSDTASNRQLASHGKHTKKHKGNSKFPYDLVSQQDDSGSTVWFVEALTGQFLELSGSDAAHMIRTGGKWIPKWIGKHGFKLRKVGEAIEGMQHYMSGGVIKPEMSYAMGGVVNSPNSNYDTQAISNVGGNVHHKKVEQNFAVTTQGETDWNYVMRLAAMHAQGSF